MWMRRIAGALLVAMQLAGPASAEATGLTQRLGLDRRGDRSTEDVTAYIARVPPSIRPIPLAITDGDGVHWTLANRTGERFTVASGKEFEAGIAALAPEAAGKRESVAVYISGEMLFRSGRSALFGDTAIFVVVDGQAYPVLGQIPSTKSVHRIGIQPRLELLADEWSITREVIWQFSRPISREAIRTLALEPGGPTVLPRRPVVDAATRRAVPDVVDPNHLARGLGALSGQIALVTGRVEEGFLSYRALSGTEARVAIVDLIDAAEKSDVGLVVLGSTSSRQPGTRNWLWQRIEVATMAAAIEQQSLGSFLATLVGSEQRLAVHLFPSASGDRTKLGIAPVDNDGSPNGLASMVIGAWSGIVSETAGRVGITGVMASLVSAERQRELDRRLVPGIPSLLQLICVSIVVVAVLALPTLLRWWVRIWPPENAGEYENRAGYLLASGTRLLLFSVVFLPVAGLPALIARLGGLAIGAQRRVRAGPAAIAAAPEAIGKDPTASSPRSL
ncbi:MAG: hypothetical protein SFW09_19510 [Hyphomicrobiaceae bacterium]|nr:hypothetical protein [Hyphomicrobiaceae bacterium]